MVQKQLRVCPGHRKHCFPAGHGLSHSWYAPETKDTLQALSNQIILSHLLCQPTVLAKEVKDTLINEKPDGHGKMLCLRRFDEYLYDAAMLPGHDDGFNCLI